MVVRQGSDAESRGREGDRRPSTMSGVERLAALRQTADNLIRKMQMFSASVDDILTQGPHARHNDALAAHFPSHPSTLDALAHDAGLRASLQERAAGMIARLEPWYGLMLDIALFDQQATKALKETAEKAPVVSVRCSCSTSHAFSKGGARHFRDGGGGASFGNEILQ